MPSIRNVLESPTDQDTFNTLLSSSTSISLQTPISRSEVILIVIAAFFALVATAAILRVYISTSVSDSCPQTATRGARKIWVNVLRSFIREVPSAGSASCHTDLHGGDPCHDPEPGPNPRSDALYPTVPLSGSRNDVDDESAILSVHAGFTSVLRRGQRNRTGSQSSAATSTTATTITTTASDSLCTTTIPRSSVTSMTSALEHSDSEADLDGIIGTGEEGFVYEVKRAQTQSMEVKRGVLVCWRFSDTNTQQRASLSSPPPIVVVSESEEPADAFWANSSTTDTRFPSDGFLHPQSTPSLCSLPSSESSTSSISVDLDEFPLPPKLITSPSRSTSFLTVPGNNVTTFLKDDTREPERSTVDHVIMLYVLESD
ncbi:hypothetical protein E1B28_000796 [Marasmius oreades]|uniref:Uncharacterized protein n=1 Tax=Marasmius oreades TaxID=181124 RepID=A0A9P7V264_9AGAR|nr:uncharacterized protein E1B28_000796 [Marasmius oreades]KAG7098896.1 hypothetical protein E1B28_000796 [Marasmius oreades]